MKLFNRFLLVLLVLALSLSALTACQLASGDETTADAETTKTPETTVGETDAESETEAETLGDETTAAPEYKTITIAEALELCGESGNITTERIAL